MVGRKYSPISTLTCHYGITFLVDLQQGDNTAMAYIEHLFPSVETRWNEVVIDHCNLSTSTQLEAFVETR